MKVSTLCRILLFVTGLPLLGFIIGSTPLIVLKTVILLLLLAFFIVFIVLGSAGLFD